MRMQDSIGKNKSGPNWTRACSLSLTFCLLHPAMNNAGPEREGLSEGG